MARLPRIVIPGIAHHVTQRGNRRLPIFFSDDDRKAYLAGVVTAVDRSRTICLAWCLMDNHAHLVLVPEFRGRYTHLCTAHACVPCTGVSPRLRGEAKAMRNLESGATVPSPLAFGPVV